MPEKECPFAELVDLNIIKNVFDGFFKVTNFQQSLTDLEGNVLVTVGFKSICSDFHRVHPETLKRCIESDTNLSSLSLNAKGGYACYKCLNGLVEAVTPIIIDGKHMANLFIGQFFLDSVPDREFFRKQAEEFGFHVENYLNALDEIPVYTLAQIEEAVQFLAAQARLIGEMALSNKNLVRLNEELEEKVKLRTCQLNKEVEDRKRALAELETVFANSSVAIIHVEGDYKIHNINDRCVDMFGFSREEAVGKDMSIFHVSPEKHRAVAETHRPLLEAGKTIQYENQFRRKNGEFFWCSLYGKAIDPDRLEHGIILVMDDITERKELETLKSDVSRIMHHDLKSPLNGIMGMGQLLLLDDNLTQAQRDDLGLILDSGYRMGNQINQSLNLYKMETGTYELNPERVDILGIFRRLLHAMRHDAAAKQVEFKVSVNGKPMEESHYVGVRGESMLSHTMLANLLTNALEACPVKTTIAITLTEASGLLTVAINNAGVVHEDVRDTFFGKYVTYGKVGGTGLGTYSAKLMAEIQEGIIAMETSEQTGTTVTIQLPMDQSSQD